MWPYHKITAWLISSKFQCYARDCLEYRSQLSQAQKEEKYCHHLKQAEIARRNNVKADEFHVHLSKLTPLNLDESELKVLNEASKNGSIVTYLLPGSNIVVPSLLRRSHDNPLELLHLRKAFICVDNQLMSYFLFW